MKNYKKAPLFNGAYEQFIAKINNLRNYLQLRAFFVPTGSLSMRYMSYLYWRNMKIVYEWN